METNGLEIGISSHSQERHSLSPQMRSDVGRVESCVWRFTLNKKSRLEMLEKHS